MNMIERVARALALEMYPDTRWPDNQRDADSGIPDRQSRYPVSWHYVLKCRAQAYTAIEAMREPTGEMTELAYAADSTDEVWRIMIDAALKEE